MPMRRRQKPSRDLGPLYRSVTLTHKYRGGTSPNMSDGGAAASWQNHGYYQPTQGYPEASQQWGGWDYSQWGSTEAQNGVSNGYAYDPHTYWGSNQEEVSKEMAQDSANQTESTQVNHSDAYPAQHLTYCEHPDAKITQHSHDTYHYSCPRCGQSGYYNPYQPQTDHSLPTENLNSSGWDQNSDWGWGNDQNHTDPLNNPSNEDQSSNCHQTSQVSDKTIHDSLPYEANEKHLPPLAVNGTDEVIYQSLDQDNALTEREISNVQHRSDLEPSLHEQKSSKEQTATEISNATNGDNSYPDTWGWDYSSNWNQSALANGDQNNWNQSNEANPTPSDVTNSHVAGASNNLECGNKIDAFQQSIPEMPTNSEESEPPSYFQSSEIKAEEYSAHAVTNEGISNQWGTQENWSSNNMPNGSMHQATNASFEGNGWPQTPPTYEVTYQQDLVEAEAKMAPHESSNYASEPDLSSFQKSQKSKEQKIVCEANENLEGSWSEKSFAQLANYDELANRRDSESDNVSENQLDQSSADHEMSTYHNAPRENEVEQFESTADMNFSNQDASSEHETISLLTQSLATGYSVSAVHSGRMVSSAVENADVSQTPFEPESVESAKKLVCEQETPENQLTEILAESVSENLDKLSSEYRMDAIPFEASNVEIFEKFNSNTPIENKNALFESDSRLQNYEATSELDATNFHQDPEPQILTQNQFYSEVSQISNSMINENQWTMNGKDHSGSPIEDLSPKMNELEDVGVLDAVDPENVCPDLAWDNPEWDQARSALDEIHFGQESEALSVSVPPEDEVPSFEKSHGSFSAFTPTQNEIQELSESAVEEKKIQKLLNGNVNFVAPKEGANDSLGIYSQELGTVYDELENEYQTGGLKPEEDPEDALNRMNSINFDDPRFNFLRSESMANEQPKDSVPVSHFENNLNSCSEEVKFSIANENAEDEPSSDVTDEKTVLHQNFDGWNWNEESSPRQQVAEISHHRLGDLHSETQKEASPDQVSQETTSESYREQFLPEQSDVRQENTQEFLPKSVTSGIDSLPEQQNFPAVYSGGYNPPNEVSGEQTEDAQNQAAPDWGLNPEQMLINQVPIDYQVPLETYQTHHEPAKVTQLEQKSLQQHVTTPYYPDQAQDADNFQEPYAHETNANGWGGWEEWNNEPNCDALYTNLQTSWRHDQMPAQIEQASVQTDKMESEVPGPAIESGVSNLWTDNSESNQIEEYNYAWSGEGQWSNTDVPMEASAGSNYPPDQFEVSTQPQLAEPSWGLPNNAKLQIESTETALEQPKSPSLEASAFVNGFDEASNFPSEKDEEDYRFESVDKNGAGSGWETNAWDSWSNEDWGQEDKTEEVPEISEEIDKAHAESALDVKSKDNSKANNFPNQQSEALSFGKGDSANELPNPPMKKLAGYAAFELENSFTPHTEPFEKSPKTQDSQNSQGQKDHLSRTKAIDVKNLNVSPSFAMRKGNGVWAKSKLATEADQSNRSENIPEKPADSISESFTQVTEENLSGVTALDISEKGTFDDVEQDQSNFSEARPVITKALPLETDPPSKSKKNISSAMSMNILPDKPKPVTNSLINTAISSGPRGVKVSDSTPCTPKMASTPQTSAEKTSVAREIFTPLLRNDQPRENHAQQPGEVNLNEKNPEVQENAETIIQQEMPKRTSQPLKATQNFGNMHPSYQFANQGYYYPGYTQPVPSNQTLGVSPVVNHGPHSNNSSFYSDLETAFDSQKTATAPIESGPQSLPQNLTGNPYGRPPSAPHPYSYMYLPDRLTTPPPGVMGPYPSMMPQYGSPMMQQQNMMMNQMFTHWQSLYQNYFYNVYYPYTMKMRRSNHVKQNASFNEFTAPSEVSSEGEETETVQVSPRKTDIVGRLTPKKFNSLHSLAKFSPGGQFLFTDCFSVSKSEIFFSSKILSAPKSVTKFPGPFTADKSHKLTVKSYLTDKIKLAEREGKKELVILLQYLYLLVQQNGTVCGTDISEILLADDTPAHSDVDDVLLTQGAIVDSREKHHLNQLRKYLILGKMYDFVNYAVTNSCWGIALRFTSLMTDDFYNYVQQSFDSTHLEASDPLVTFILVKSRSALPVDHLNNCWSDWQKHLSILLSNQTEDVDYNQRCLVLLGDALFSRGLKIPAQLCYVLAGEPFVLPTEKEAKLVLLGYTSDSSSFASLDFDSIFLTMIFEYAVHLNNKICCFPSLQIFKFLLAKQLVEFGLPDLAFKYCRDIAYNLEPNARHFTASFISEFFDFSNQLFIQSGLTEKPQWILQLDHLFDDEDEEEDETDQVEDFIGAGSSAYPSAYDSNLPIEEQTAPEPAFIPTFPKDNFPSPGLPLQPMFAPEIQLHQPPEVQRPPSQLSSPKSLAGSVQNHPYYPDKDPTHLPQMMEDEPDSRNLGSDSLPAAQPDLGVPTTLADSTADLRYLKAAATDSSHMFEPEPTVKTSAAVFDMPSSALQDTRSTFDPSMTEKEYKHHANHARYRRTSGYSENTRKANSPLRTRFDHSMRDSLCSTDMNDIFEPGKEKRTSFTERVQRHMERSVSVNSDKSVNSLRYNTLVPEQDESLTEGRFSNKKEHAKEHLDRRGSITPKPEQKPTDKKLEVAKSGHVRKSSWLSEKLSNVKSTLISLVPAPNQMHLPDDKSSDFYFDPVKKKWVDKTKPDQEDSGPPPPPKMTPVAPSIPAPCQPAIGLPAPSQPTSNGAVNPPGLPSAPPAGGNPFARGKGLARNKYVDVLAKSNTVSTAPSAFPPPTIPTPPHMLMNPNDAFPMDSSEPALPSNTNFSLFQPPVPSSGTDSSSYPSSDHQPPPIS